MYYSIEYVLAPPDILVAAETLILLLKEFVCFLKKKRKKKKIFDHFCYHWWLKFTPCYSDDEV